LRKKTNNHTRNKKWELIINMDEDFVRYTIAPIIGLALFFLLLGGCATNKDKGKYELLYYEDNYATKNVDIKEITKKDTC